MKRFVQLVLKLTGKQSMTRYVKHDIVLSLYDTNMIFFAHRKYITHQNSSV
jgi:hypothetical protein